MGVSFDFSAVEKQLEAEMQVVEERKDKALQTAADYLVEELQSAAKSTFTKTGRGRGDLAASIKKGKNDGTGIEVFPQGNNSRGQPNATVGMVQEYGRSNMAGTAWFSSTVERCKARILEIIKENMQGE